MIEIKNPDMHHLSVFYFRSFILYIYLSYFYFTALLFLNVIYDNL